MNSRAMAANAINSVVSERKSLADILPKLLENVEDKATRSYIKQLCFGVLRHYRVLSAYADLLLTSPTKAKNWDIFCLLLVGIYQIRFLSTPAYAAVSETVNATRKMKKPWAASVINKTLRRFIDEQDQLSSNISTRPGVTYSHPDWLVTRLQQDWPEQWIPLLEANNAKAPMFVRVNQQQITREDFVNNLQAADIPARLVDNVAHAVEIIEPCSVQMIPGFEEGHFYVQDISGQMAVALLDLMPEQSVLDCCAAPGSKTTHMLETQPELKSLVAIDNQVHRLPKIRENLQRLKLPYDHLYLTLADASHVEQWWHGDQFDRMLIDAPCSATGVIRRHQDIKWLRQDSDIKSLTQVQALLLHKLWPLLKPGGRLLYSTCSILKDENEKQAQRFLKQHKDAKPVNFELPYGNKQSIGWQILPEPNGPDGFYYALFEKKV